MKRILQPDEYTAGLEDDQIRLTISVDIGDGDPGDEIIPRGYIVDGCPEVARRAVLQQHRDTRVYAIAVRRARARERSGVGDGKIRPSVSIEISNRHGDRVRLRPAHVDPTVSKHECLHLVDGDDVVDHWDIDLRHW